MDQSVGNIDVLFSVSDLELSHSDVLHLTNADGAIFH